MNTITQVLVLVIMLLLVAFLWQKVRGGSGGMS